MLSRFEMLGGGCKGTNWSAALLRKNLLPVALPNWLDREELICGIGMERLRSWIKLLVMWKKSCRDSLWMGEKVANWRKKGREIQTHTVSSGLIFRGHVHPFCRCPPTAFCPQGVCWPTIPGALLVKGVLQPGEKRSTEGWEDQAGGIPFDRQPSMRQRRVGRWVGLDKRGDPAVPEPDREETE